MRKTAQKKGVFLMLLSAAATCTGQLMWKLSAGAGNAIPLLGVGFALYGLGAILMIVAFRYGEVSVLQPILSVGFVLSLVLGALVLHEEISPQKLAGVALIIAGIFILSRYGGKKKQ